MVPEVDVSRSSSIRVDPFRGGPHIVAPSRAERPGGAVRAVPEEPASVDDDPFLEGREDRTPPEVFAIRPDGSPPNGPGWRVRIITNQYPALRPDDADPASAGRHEVVIECPHFETCLSRLPLDGVRDVLFAYRERLRTLRDEGRWACAVVFKNKGRAAGATIAHAHSQILALPFVPGHVADALRRARERTNVPTEHDELVDETERATLVCPHASRFPYEMRIVPRPLESRFEQTDDATLADTAKLLRTGLRALHAHVGEAAYNLGLHSLPFGEKDTPGDRWTIDVLPRLTTFGGFELATGTMINPVPPETAAAQLREAV